ncbi:MAG: hypothetical protein K6C36_06405 [Clostridia bacterium]|nr:hypothetical protein [Clostridia bacterium]
MATRAMNLRVEENELAEMRAAASALHMTVTDVVRAAVREYLEEVRKDPYYILTSNVKEADAEESAEILEAVGELSADDLEIASSRRLEV